MEKITWKQQCFVCNRPILGGNPCVVFSTDKPGLVGICHARCSYGLYRYRYGWFHMHPPDSLSSEQVSFLMHFYIRLYSLPGGMEPNGQLRRYLSYLIREYPPSMIKPMESFRLCLDEQKGLPNGGPYEGDLETDFLRSLGDIQRSARMNPVHVEIDFRSHVNAAAKTNVNRD